VQVGVSKIQKKRGHDYKKESCASKERTLCARALCARFVRALCARTKCARFADYYCTILFKGKACVF
jgi:hypothetical protein